MPTQEDDDDVVALDMERIILQSALRAKIQSSLYAALHTRFVAMPSSSPAEVRAMLKSVTAEVLAEHDVYSIDNIEIELSTELRGDPIVSYDLKLDFEKLKEK